MHRARQDVPAVAPELTVVFDELRTAFCCRWFGTGPVELLAHAGYEVAKVVAEQHDDAVCPGDVLAASDLRSVPAVLFGQQYMRLVGGDAQFSDIADGRFLLRTRIRIACYRIAGAIGNEKYGDTRCLSCIDETGNTGHRVGRVLIVPFLELPLRHRRLERHLKFRIADRRLIDIENDGGRQI